MDTKINTLCIGEKKMKWFSFGNTSKEKLVVLPGLSLKSVMPSADGIVNSYSAAAEDYELYFFDRIEVFPASYGISEMAEDTYQALNQLNLNQVHIMGVSQGGMIALKLALAHPECVKSLTLCSSASRIRPAAYPVFEKWKQSAAEKDISSLVHAFGEAVYTPSFFKQYKDIITAIPEVSDQEYSNFITSLNGTADFDVYDQLGELKCPVSVIGAGEDRILGREASEEIIRKLNCTGYIYEGYGHGVYDEAPGYLNRVTDFLKSI